MCLVDPLSNRLNAGGVLDAHAGRCLAALLAVAVLLVAPPALAVTYLNGFDVYTGDGTVNWTTAKNAGYSFAFVKATDGVNYVDPKFNANMQNSKAAGVNVGPYHFCRVASIDGDPFTSYDGSPFQPGSDPYLDATSEASDFLDAIKPKYLSGQYLPPVADVENLPDFGSTSLNRTFISNWVQLFSDTVYNSLGIRPIIYVSKSNANTNYTNAVAAAHKLWIAWWKGTGTTSPPKQSDTPQWSRWQFWQYAVDETVPGVPGSNNGVKNPDGTVKLTVDTDVFEGTVGDLKKLLLGKDGSVPGDFNRDGKVDTADYVLWRSTTGQKVPLYTGADGDGNATVNTADFTVWKLHFGQTGSVPTAAGLTSNEAVPEPSTLVLAVALFVFFAARTRSFFYRGR